LKKLIAITAAVAALAVPAAASAKVKLLHVNNSYPGGIATLTASVTPNAACQITVNYKSGPSHASGLYPKRSVNRRVSWTWNVGTRTTPGRWGIVVSCGNAGTLYTSFVVS
jgi:hypothetical protein